jgi:transcriptional regulator GlxA family with amidase domain
MISGVTHHVVFVVFDDFEILDLTGPLEVFSAASRLSGEEAYSTVVASELGGELRASCGLRIHADRLTDHGARINTLVVVGGGGAGAAVGNDALIDWVRAAASRTDRVTSVCTGAFVLAQAGVLAGKRATTHWSACDRLAALFPDTTVERDPIFVRDGKVWTSAGVTAGMDLALKLVEDDLGPDLARAVARWLVLFVQRSGGQSQFSTQLAAQRPASPALRQLEGFIADHLHEDLGVSALATRSSMSPRHFARVFRAETGITPAAYVEAARIEAARRLLETTGAGVGEIARSCGFRTVETLHRSFRRALGTTPGQYRRHFGTPASA